MEESPTSEEDKTLLRGRPKPDPSPPSLPPATTGGSSWSDLSRWATADSTPLDVGSVINNRFILEECIGRGGMGTVFRARDVRKEEAQDRNPYVAIKVLNEDFKRHPQSLQALQRESRKAQKLAHPNIVTVFDFDRDGANVYMVMELLEGEPLDRLIKRTEGRGLGMKEAVRIMRGICRAMDYAHEQGIVHADFKPANAFLTSSGVVKVFDFGIARAVKLTGPAESPAESNLTLFDPGTLGALTPGYAGCEVIEGADPDPRDDIYAMACVAYELITGKHPFDRLSATQAEAAGLTPKQPAGVSARQWRALRRGLQFRRDGRPKSAFELLDGVRPLRRSPALFVTAGVAALAGLALAAMLVSSQIDRYRERHVVSVLASADESQIEPMLRDLRTLDPARRASLLLHEDAREGLIKYLEGRANALVDVGKGRYDYPRAEVVLREMEEFFPDSQAVGDFRDRLTARKSEEIKRQSDAFDLYLQRGWLIPAQNRENVGSVLTIVRQVDPKNLLLHDPRLPGAFAQSSRQALQRGQPELADALVTAGLALAPHDAALTDLKDQAQRAVSFWKLQARKNVLEQSVRALVASPDVLAAVDDHGKDIDELRSVDPHSQALSDLQRPVQHALDVQLATRVARQQFDSGLELLARYADLVSPAYVDTKRKELLTAQSRLDVHPPATEPAPVAAQTPVVAAQTPVAAAQTPVAAAQTPVAAAQTPVAAPKPVAPDPASKPTTAQHEGTEEQWRAQLADGLDQPTLSLEQARTLAAAIEELTLRGDPDVLATKRKLTTRLAQVASTIKAKEGIDAAVTFTKGAYALFPESPLLKKTLVNLLVVEAQRASTERGTAITSIKRRIEALLKDPTLDNAWDGRLKQELRRLAVYLPETDPYVREIKSRVSYAYVTQAGKLRDAQRLTEAGRMLERSSEYASQSAERVVEEALLSDARTRAELGQKESDRAAYLSSLKQKLIIQAQANDVTAAQTSLRVLGESLPANDRFMKEDGPGAIAQAYGRLARSALGDGQFKSAVEIIQRGRSVAPTMESLAELQGRYARYQALDEYLATDAAPDVRKVRSEIAALSGDDPRAAKVAVPLLARHFSSRIHATDDPELASRLLHKGREMFIGDPLFRGN